MRVMLLVMDEGEVEDDGEGSEAEDKGRRVPPCPQSHI